MKDFLKNHGLWILFAGAVIAVALALLSYFSTNASPLVDLTNTITSPFRAVCTSVSGWFTDKQNYYEDVTALKAENEALKKQIAEMEATVRQGEAASQENVFLRDLLDLRQQRRQAEAGFPPRLLPAVGGRPGSYLRSGRLSAPGSGHRLCLRASG